MIPSQVTSPVSAVVPPATVGMPAWKRALDVVLILLALPVAVPMMAVIAVVIWAVSPGPILFRQERVGFRGRRFLCLKFRTMVVGADPGMHQGHLQDLLKSEVPMVKMDAKGDPRVIPLGFILRASGLDELPQLINVLRGEMSLVGPRPCLPYEFEAYLPWQKERFEAVPGLTGLWQVSGKNRTTFVEMVRLDIKYAREKSLWLDLKIIFKTLPALIVQMRDQRQRKKNQPTPARSGTVVPGRTAADYGIRETTTAAPGPLLAAGHPHQT